MGGVLVHIKAFTPHPIPHQSDVSTESVGPLRLRHVYREITVKE